MNIEFFRDYCLALGGVDEKIPFGKFARRYDSILVFYVSGHMFCLTDLYNFSFVDIPSTPDEIARLSDNYASISHPLNRAFVNWIRLNLNGDIPDRVILSHVRRAHEIIRSKYSKTVKASPKAPPSRLECATPDVDIAGIQLGLDSCSD